MTPTRQEMARACEQRVEDSYSLRAYNDQSLLAAATELRKSCASCQHMLPPSQVHQPTKMPTAWCLQNSCPIKADGIGYCTHAWEAKR